jgi:phospholipase D1/2
MSDEPGDRLKHCWRIGEASRLALLVDGSEYFGALRESLLAAEKSIFIFGWDVDSRTRITGANRKPEDGAPADLRSLLSKLVARAPGLNIRILLWDYSLLYALERELLPKFALGWRTPDRVDIALDGQFPIGASQHHKLVVIDDKIAYIGGLDLTIRRWDTPEHLADDPRREDPSGKPYPPFHDLQAVVDGEPAKILAEYCQQRWRRVTGSTTTAVQTDTDPWPARSQAIFEEVQTGIARTLAAFDDQEETREIEKTYLAAISTATRFIYIENQYFTAHSIADALIRRLQENDALEVLVVCPREPGGWLEAKTMGAGRERVMARIDEAGLRERFRFMEPVVDAGGEHRAIMVHAKFMTVDDRLLTIGSANCNNRSMGLDTECNLVLDCEERRHRDAIASLRHRLIAEHCGLDTEAIQQIFAADKPVLPRLAQLADGPRRLEPIDCEGGQYDDELTRSIGELADPEEPVDLTNFLPDSFDVTKDPLTRTRLLGMAAGLAAVAALWAIWQFTPIEELGDPASVASYLNKSDSKLGSVIATLSIFVLGGLLFFPVTVLVAASAMVLGPWLGFGTAFLGTLLSAAACFAVGRRMHPSVARWIPQSNRRILDRALKDRAVVAVAIIRNVPIAPFSAVNLLAGQTQIGLLPFLLGTAVGMAPGVAVLTLMGDRLRVLWSDPSVGNILLLAGAIVVWIVVALFLQWAANQVKQKKRDT